MPLNGCRTPNPRPHFSEQFAVEDRGVECEGMKLAHKEWGNGRSAIRCLLWGNEREYKRLTMLSHLLSKMPLVGGGSRQFAKRQSCKEGVCNVVVTASLSVMVNCSSPVPKLCEVVLLAICPLMKRNS